jgi:hypothetical protein
MGPYSWCLQAPSGALSQENECDKGEDTPMSLNETRSLSNDKGVPSQQEHTKILEVTTMHSDSESTLVSLRADKSGSTLPPLDKRAKDKNEDGEEGPAPPPLFKRNPEDKEEGHWRRFSDPATQAKISAIKETNKKQREARKAQEMSSSATGGWIKPKQKDLTGSWLAKRSR